MEIIKKVQQFFMYWYVRYLLATELYMVETWEKIAVHILFAILFGILWTFNYNIVLTAVSRLRPSTNWIEAS